MRLPFKMPTGKKEDLPELIEGIMALTTDTKELFFGSEFGNIPVKEQLSVEQFGIKGNNEPIDENQLKKAIDYAIQENMILYFPNGEYDLDGFTYNISDDLCIKGEHKEKTILKNGDYFSLTFNIYAENLTFKDFSGEQGRVFYYELNEYNDEPIKVSIIIKNCIFDNCSRGVQWLSSDDIPKEVTGEVVYIEKCLLKDMRAGGISIPVNIEDKAIIKNNEFLNFTHADFRVGLRLGASPEGMGDVLISNNIFDGFAHPDGEGSSTAGHYPCIFYANHAKLIGNTFKNVDYLENCYCRGEGQIIANNTFDNRDSFSQVAIAAKEGGETATTIFVNNNIYGKYEYGLWTTTFALIANNKFNVDANQYVVQVRSNSESDPYVGNSNIIIGNKIINTNQEGDEDGKYSGGIYSTRYNKQLIIKNNEIECHGPGIYVGSNGVKNVDIKDNLINTIGGRIVNIREYTENDEPAGKINIEDNDIYYGDNSIDNTAKLVIENNKELNLIGNNIKPSPDSDFETHGEDHLTEIRADIVTIKSNEIDGNNYGTRTFYCFGNNIYILNNKIYNINAEHILQLSSTSDTGGEKIIKDNILKVDDLGAGLIITGNNENNGNIIVVNNYSNDIGNIIRSTDNYEVEDFIVKDNIFEDDFNYFSGETPTINGREVKLHNVGDDLPESS